MERPAVRVCVLGAGVVGLSTAVRLQDRLGRVVSVTVTADRFGPDTVSDGAAGLFVPTAERLPGVPLVIAKKWMRASFSQYDQIAYSPEGAAAGVQVVAGYCLYDTDVPPPTFHDVIYDCRRCTQNELDSLPRKYKCGYFATTVLVECRRYLPWLEKRFRGRGGQVVHTHIKSFSELSGMYDVVVNCTGLGSRQLVSDDVMEPMRGQTIRVKAPWLKLFYRDVPNLTSVIPCYDTVLLGGTRQMNTFDVAVNKEDSQHVWEKCCSLVPSLEGALVLWEWSGLRPWRQPLRLETETVSFHSGRPPLQVVHNYGHGSTGVAMSWGTAVQAAELVDDLVRDTVPASKL